MLGTVSKSIQVETLDTIWRLYGDATVSVIRDSPLIVFGRCGPCRPYPPNAQEAGSIETVHVIKVLKGELAKAEINVAEASPLSPSATPGRTYIFFLRPWAGGYQFMFHQHTAAALAAPPGRTQQETIENMLAAALGSQDTSPGDRWWDSFVLASDPSPNPLVTQGFENALKWTPANAQGQIIAVLIARRYPPALGLAEAFLSHTDWADQTGPITSALGVLGGERAVQLLSSVARASEPEPAREYALSALGETHSVAALPALETGLRDADWRVRTGSATALGRSMLPGGIPFLADALDDPVEAVRFAAYRSLVSISEHAPEAALDEKDFQAHEAQYIAQWKKWAHENAPGGGQG